MPRATITLLVTLAIFFLLSRANAFTWDQTPIRCDRPHEEYQCGSACQRTCPTLGQPCLIANVVCNRRCYCKEGYARIDSDDSRCIPISECPVYKKVE